MLGGCLCVGIICVRLLFILGDCLCMGVFCLFAVLLKTEYKGKGHGRRSLRDKLGRLVSAGKMHFDDQRELLALIRLR